MRGYAVTSYAAQGKNVDYVLFSDSAVRAATNQQQWYVTISRGRRGVKIFTADKIQLRENVARSGNRPLALDMAVKVRFTSCRQCGGAMCLTFSTSNIRSACWQSDRWKPCGVKNPNGKRKPGGRLKRPSNLNQRNKLNPRRHPSPPSRWFKNLKPSGSGLKFRRAKPTNQAGA